MSRTPEVKWAQRIDKVYITVQLPDTKDAKVNLEPDGVFSFSGNAGTQLYECKLDLNDKVNVEASKINVGVRSIFCIIEKAEAKWWKKLVRDERTPHFIKVDWDKWVDEDDDGTDGVNMDGMDFSNFGGMGGMGDMAGLGGLGGMGDLGGMGGMGGLGGMGGMGGLSGMGGMGMDDFEDESDDEEEVSKPQAEGKAVEAEKTESAETKTEAAQSS